MASLHIPFHYSSFPTASHVSPHLTALRWGEILILSSMQHERIVRPNTPGRIGRIWWGRIGGARRCRRKDEVEWWPADRAAHRSCLASCLEDNYCNIPFSKQEEDPSHLPATALLPLQKDTMQKIATDALEDLEGCSRCNLIWCIESWKKTINLIQ